MFLFVILFGLSMDYHVFILSRVREYFDRGMDTEHAVAKGIKSTAGVVTSAAVVMMFVFAVFATMPHHRHEGDGDRPRRRRPDRRHDRPRRSAARDDEAPRPWNWYLPTWLEWLPRLERERETETAPAR